MSADQERDGVARKLQRRASSKKLCAKRMSGSFERHADESNLTSDAELMERAASLLRGDGLGRLVRHPKFWQLHSTTTGWSVLFQNGGKPKDAAAGPSLEAAVAAALAVLDSEGEPEEEKRRSEGLQPSRSRPEEYR